MVLSLALLAALAAFWAVRNLTLSRQSLPFAGPQFVNLTTQPSQQPSSNSSESTPELTPEATLVSAPVIEASLKPWDGAGRVTILLIGLDYRDWEAKNDYSRSDTMILLTLDPQTRTAGILSVPRDMWVAIPGFTHGKINTAYYLGEAYKLPGGGPALATKTMEQFLGVPINYYAQIDFSAFVQFIDEIGGVKIDVPEPITIDLLGDGSQTKKKLKAGAQVLPGEWALAYARNRYTENGDFDRARRQQQVIMGIRNQILRFDMLPTLIRKAPSLYQELASGIRTNLSLEDVMRLALLAADIPEEKIGRGILGKGYVLFGKSPDNLDILIPIPDKIHLVRDQIFATGSGLEPGTPGNSQEQMQAEAARLAVYNGTQQGDLGDRTAEFLRINGANIVGVAAADKSYTLTTVIDHTGNPFTLAYLVETLGVTPTRVISQFDPNSSVDVEVILGADWRNSNSLP